MDNLDSRFARLSDPGRTAYLIGSFISGSLTIAEREELDAWVIEDPANMKLFEDMTDEAMIARFMQWHAEQDTEAELHKVKQRLKFKKSRVIQWWHYAAAVGLIALAGWGISMIIREGTPSPTVAEQRATPSDLAPGIQQAQLRLPSGEIVYLDGVRDTLVGSIRIMDGQIVYQESLDTLLHEVNVPRKGYYVLQLPDGTRVHLNSGSSIRYPGAFGATRTVYVTGETYFEVSPDRSRPFIVDLDSAEVVALGTAFNVNGYTKKVTLTHGSIRVGHGGGSVILKPGEQVDLDSWKVKKVHTDIITAWTRNQFKFKDATIREVLEPVGRWYDATIQYEDINYHFNGTIDRNIPVSQVLKLLELTGHVSFEISGDTILARKRNDGQSQ